MSSHRWATQAAAKFTAALPAPAVAGAGSTRAYRDIKGWIAALVHAVHAVRWASLASSVSEAISRGVTQDAAVCAVTRAIIERVVVRQPSESRRIVTSNARRQCARLTGRLSLVRLVDLALALSRIRRTANVAGDYVVAHAFWQLVKCLRALRAVHDMDSTARSIDLCLFDPAWAAEHASDDAYAQHMAPPVDARGHAISAPSAPAAALHACVTAAVSDARTRHTAQIIRLAVFRASRLESVVDSAPPPSLSLSCAPQANILMAAFVADFDPSRALAMADHCVELREDVIARVRAGSGPLPLKDLRMILFCDNVMQRVSSQSEVAFIMQKLSQLFVPVGWHAGGAETFNAHTMLRELSSKGNFSAEAALGRRLAERGYPEGHGLLVRAHHKGDVAAPIVLGDLLRKGGTGIGKNVISARDYYQAAIARGSALAALNLAYMYLEREFPEHAADAGKQAAKWFQVSVDRGNARAALELGKVLFHGASGEPRDLDRAERCFAIAADRTTLQIVKLRATIGLAKVAAERGDITKAECLFNEVLDAQCANGDLLLHTPPADDVTAVIAEALFAMAHMFKDASTRVKASALGESPVSTERFRERACECFLKAAHIAQSQSHTSQARLYHEPGTAGSSMTESAARAWYGLGLLRLEMHAMDDALAAFRNATHLGHIHAPHNLGNLLLRKGDSNGALSAFEIGAVRGDKSAANNAGLLHARERKDYHAALLCYEKAILLESAAAPANLARLYLKGVFGNDKRANEMRVRYLVKTAVDRGNSEGVKDLLQIFNAQQQQRRAAAANSAGATVADINNNTTPAAATNPSNVAQGAKRQRATKPASPAQQSARYPGSSATSRTAKRPRTALVQNSKSSNIVCTCVCASLPRTSPWNAPDVLQWAVHIPPVPSRWQGDPVGDCCRETQLGMRVSNAIRSVWMIAKEISNKKKLHTPDAHSAKVWAFVAGSALHRQIVTTLLEQGSCYARFKRSVAVKALALHAAAVCFARVCEIASSRSIEVKDREHERKHENEFVQMDVGC